MSPRTTFRIRSSLFALVFVAGCSSSGSSAGTAESTCASFGAVDQACTGVLVEVTNSLTNQASCVTALSLPGAPTAAAFTACANAVLQTGCAAGLEIPECDLRGTLPAGTDCNDDIQCVSGACTAPTGATCGTCAAVIPDGQPCPASVGCRAGAVCLTGTCTAVTYGAVGAACDYVTALCASDLYCAQTTTARTCSTLPTSGESCGRVGLRVDLCAPPYVCGDAQTCVTGNGAGAPCPCASGLTCDTSVDGGVSTCVTAVAAGPGQACGALGCATGACEVTTQTCPSVLADGQACAADSVTTVCGNASTCTNDVCTSVTATLNVCK